MLPKYIGRDCELSTTGVDANGQTIDPGDVTRALLEQLPRQFQERDEVVWSRKSSYHYASMDCLRHWPSNGQCYYCDMSHLECCTASSLDPFDFASQCWHLVSVAEGLRRQAESGRADGHVYSLSTSNADLLDPSISFGTHLSVSVEASLWEELFLRSRHPAMLAMVSSGIAAAIPFFGAGYLLPLKDQTVYSLSARAHHISQVATLSTTEPFKRGLLNSRREPHGAGMERLHLIGFDFCLPSSPLLCSYLQCLLAAAEVGRCDWQLYDPVHAMRTWSWGLDLNSGRMPKTARLVVGGNITLPAYLRAQTSALLEMCRSGQIPESVAPQAQMLLPKIIELTHYAEEGSVGHCARHLSWAAKLLCLLDICESEGATLGDARTRLADHDFANTDPQRGPIWSLWDQGVIDPLVTRAQVDACWHSAPRNSRDFARGQLIRRFSDRIASLDWGEVELRRTLDQWGARVKIELPRMDSLCDENSLRMIATSTSVDQLNQRLKLSARDFDPLENVTGQLALPDNEINFVSKN